MADEAPKDKSKRKRKRPSATSQDKLQQMFLKYCELNGNKAATARAFGVANTTINRYERKHDWIERRMKTDRQVQDRADRAAVNQGVKNLKTATALRNAVAVKVAKGLQQAGAYEPTVGEFVAISKYVDHLEGVDDSSGKGDLLIAIFNQLGEPDNSERERLVDALFAGLGIFDRATRDRASTVLHSSLHTQN